MNFVWKQRFKGIGISYYLWKGFAFILDTESRPKASGGNVAGMVELRVKVDFCHELSTFKEQSLANIGLGKG